MPRTQLWSGLSPVYGVGKASQACSCFNFNLHNHGWSGDTDGLCYRWGSIIRERLSRLSKVRVAGLMRAQGTDTMVHHPPFYMLTTFSYILIYGRGAGRVFVEVREHLWGPFSPSTIRVLGDQTEVVGVW